MKKKLFSTFCRDKESTTSGKNSKQIQAKKRIKNSETQNAQQHKLYENNMETTLTKTKRK